MAGHWWDVAGAAYAGLRTAWVSRTDLAYPVAMPAPDVTGPDVAAVAAAILARLSSVRGGAERARRHVLLEPVREGSVWRRTAAYGMSTIARGDALDRPRVGAGRPGGDLLVDGGVEDRRVAVGASSRSRRRR